MAILPGYTVIGEFADLNQVALLRSRFDDAGIDYVVQGEYLWSWYPLPFGRSGRGVRVLVRDEQLDEARGMVE